MNMTDEKREHDPEMPGEFLGAELWRMWASEIKPHFTAEAEFLRKYGEVAGYDRNYIGRVLSDHRLMEELVWGKDDESVGRFAKVLAAHIRYKRAFFEEKVRGLVESPAPSAGTRAAGETA